MAEVLPTPHEVPSPESMPQTPAGKKINFPAAEDIERSLPPASFVSDGVAAAKGAEHLLERSAESAAYGEVVVHPPKPFDYDETTLEHEGYVSTPEYGEIFEVLREGGANPISLHPLRERHHITDLSSKVHSTVMVDAQKIQRVVKDKGGFDSFVILSPTTKPRIAVHKEGAGSSKATWQITRAALPVFDESFEALSITHRNLETMEPKIVNELRNERRIHAYLKSNFHPAECSNLVIAREAVYLESGQAGLITEWCNGGNVESWLTPENLQKKPLSIDDKCFMAAQMATGVAQLHAKGIIHRDLKLDNFMVVLDKGKIKQVKLGDFGLSTLTHQEPLKYYPHHLPKCFKPPEIIKWEISPPNTLLPGADPQSLYKPSLDIYELGVAYYQLFSNTEMKNLKFFKKPNGEDRTAEEVLRMRQEFDNPESMPGFTAIPEPIQGMIRRMMDPDPSKRPTAAQVSELFSKIS